MSELDQALMLIVVAFTAISGLLFLLTQAEEWLSTSAHDLPVPARSKQQTPEQALPPPHGPVTRAPNSPSAHHEDHG